MQISPIPQLDDETNQIRLMTAELVAREIIPNEHFLRRGAEAAGHRARIQALVKQAGVWAPQLPDEYGGMVLGFLQGILIAKNVLAACHPRRVLGLWKSSVHVERPVFEIGSRRGLDLDHYRAVQV